ncbi:MAG: HNH endonuclease signature motif containing protein [Patescibacteria group bacterium]|jgi:hypothetical protein
MTDNSDIFRKRRIREKAIEWLGGPSAVRVLDCCAGFGHMRRECYAGVASYLGIDQRRTRQPDTLVGDNLVLAPPRVDDFDLFDIDTYGNPWPLCDLLTAARTDTAPFVLVTTCFQARHMRFGRGSGYIDSKLGLGAVFSGRARQRQRHVAQARRGDNCDRCGGSTGLEIHHIDHNPSNNAPSNLTTLCIKHHHARHRIETPTKLPSLNRWYDTFVSLVMRDWPVRVVKCYRATASTQGHAGRGWYYAILCEKANGDRKA